MGSTSINLSLTNIWHSWYKFRKGKKPTEEIARFSYFLESNLYGLFVDLNCGIYRHGGYREFIVNENKKRRIAVAGIRDRVVHRLVYEYLVNIYDKTFIFDVWSCRKNKGLTGAIERSQYFLHKYPKSFIWRGDIKKFFDNVDQDILINKLRYRIFNDKALRILTEIIKSYYANGFRRERERERVMSFAGREYPLEI